MKDVVISAEGLSKKYRLGEIGYDSLKDFFQILWYKATGKKLPVVMEKTIFHAPNVEGNYVWALKDVSFEIKRGEVVGIIGKNGAGKSTLLKILSRITSPTAGRAVIKGRVGTLLEIGTGFHPDLTGRENIYLNGAILGMKKREITQCFDDIVRFAEIGDFIDTPVKFYSSGMFVRLAFAVAAHLNCDILLVDEVLAVGDIIFRAKCIGKMQELGEEGRTVIFVSHNLAAIRALCKRTILLDFGEKKFDGNTENAISIYCASADEIDDVELIFPPANEKQAQVYRFALEDCNGKKTNQIKQGESLFAVVETEFRRDMDSSAVIIELRSKDDVCLWRSADVDRFPGLIFLREKGCYNYRVKLPSDILRGGIYKVSFSIARVGPKGVLDGDFRKSLIFRIIGEEKVFSQTESRPGIIDFVPEWEKIK